MISRKNDERKIVETWTNSFSFMRFKFQDTASILKSKKNCHKSFLFHFGTTDIKHFYPLRTATMCDIEVEQLDLSNCNTTFSLCKILVQIQPRKIERELTEFPLYLFAKIGLVHLRSEYNSRIIEFRGCVIRTEGA